MYVHEYTQRKSAKGYARCEKRERKRITLITHTKKHTEDIHTTQALMIPNNIIILLI